MDFLDIEGSLEDTIADLNEAVDRWITDVMPEEMAHAWVEATFPEYAIVGVGAPDYDRVEYWEVPYAVEEGDIVIFGEPSAVDVVGVTEDLMAPDGEVQFQPASKVLASALSLKNSSRIRRRLMVLDHLGIDTGGRHDAVNPLGSVAGSRVPSEGSEASLVSPGTVASGGPLARGDVPGSFDSDVGSVPNPNGGTSDGKPIPTWMTGQWYLDANGTLHSDPVSAGLIDDPYTFGTVDSTRRIDGQGYAESTTLGSVPAGLRLPSQGYATGADANHGNAVSVGGGSGTRGGKSLREPLINKMNERMSALLGEPETADVDDVTPLVDAAYSKALGLLTEIKAGRVLSGRNTDRVMEAFDALGQLLEDAGLLDIPAPDDIAVDTDDELDTTGVLGDDLDLDSLDPLVAEYAEVTGLDG